MIKISQPNLNNTYVIYALMSCALGLNFLFLTPPFMPLSINEGVAATVFFFSGIQLFSTLVLNRNVPTAMALMVIVLSFWAVVLTVDFVRLSQTSMQLPIFVTGHALIGYTLLIFPSPPSTETVKEVEE